MENWKDITGYEGVYQASNFGRVRNKTGLVLKPEFHYNGYLRVDLCIKGTCVKQYVHRIVATTFFRNPKDHPLVNHRDLNKQNNRTENLEWATYSYNTQHYYHHKNNRPVPVAAVIEEKPADDINGEDIPW